MADGGTEIIRAFPVWAKFSTTGHLGQTHFLLFYNQKACDGEEGCRGVSV